MPVLWPSVQTGRRAYAPTRSIRSARTFSGTDAGSRCRRTVHSPLRRARTVQPQRPPSIHGAMAVRPDDAQHRLDNAADLDRRDHAGAHRGVTRGRVGTLPAILTAAGCRRDRAVALPAGGGGGGAGGGARGGAAPGAAVGGGGRGGGWGGA